MALFATVVDRRYKEIVPAKRKTIILGTRGSELALAQSRMVAGQLKTHWPDLDVEMKIIKTRGDESKASITDLRAGRKGLFTGEIERALLAREIDFGVHSAKDLPSSLGSETKIGAVLPRASVDDVLVVKDYARKLDAFKPSSLPGLDVLPQGAVVATGSVRREYQLRWQRPDLNVVDLRGNVPTRLRKLVESDWEAIVLARAGLERLGLDLSGEKIDFERNDFWLELLPRETFLPAGGQGVIAIQSRVADLEGNMLLGVIDDRETHRCLRAEREFLRQLDADCNQPVGVLAAIAQSTMTVRAQVFDDGTTAPRTASVEGDSKDAERLATELFEEILKQ